MPLRHPIEILVAERANPLAPWHAAIAEAVVLIVGAEERPLTHDPQLGLYASDSLDEPTEVRVKHRGMTQIRRVEPRRPPIRETFFFGGPDDELVRLGGSYHPIPRMPSAVGVFLNGNLSGDHARGLILGVLPDIPADAAGLQLNRAAMEWLRNPHARLAPVVFDIPPTPQVLATLRRLPAIVGPVIHTEGNQVLILTHHLVVRFLPGPVPALKDLITDLQDAFSDLKSWNWLPGRHPRIRWTTRATLGFEVVDLARRIEAWNPHIASVEVELAASGTHDGPTDPAWPFQTSLHRMLVAQAWDQVGYGAGRVLAVLDGAAEFKHLSLGIGEFEARIATTFVDPTQPAASLDHGAKDHGILCLGVAIAASNQEGIVGVAPEASAVAGAIDVLSTVKTSQHRESLLRAAGFYPEAITAEIISVSDGFDEPNPILSALDREVLEQVVLEGRQGRGCPVFLSAGNNGAKPLDYLRGYRASPLTLTCGATTDIEAGETWATTSAPGPIDFCAPAFDAGNVPSVGIDDRLITLDLTAEQALGKLRWQGGDALAAGELVQLKRGGATVIVRVTESEFDLGTNTHVSTFEGSFDPTGCTAEVLPNTLPFGSTSAATPLCAAVGLLVLAADPLLSSIELREVLRETAERADLWAHDHVQVWLDNSGPLMPHDRLGYGRLNANAAVKEAIKRRDATPRDWPQLTIKSAWFTVGALTEAWRVRRERPMVLRVIVKNVGQRPSLEAWMRATILPVDALDAPRELGQLAFHSIPPGMTRELRLAWPAESQPPWGNFQLRVQLLPHHGPGAHAEVVYDADVAEDDPPVRTWIITPAHTIYEALDPDPAPT